MKDNCVYECAYEIVMISILCCFDIVYLFRARTQNRLDSIDYNTYDKSVSHVHYFSREAFELTCERNKNINTYICAKEYSLSGIGEA